MGKPVQALESQDKPVLPAALDDLPRLVWRRKYWIASSLVVGLAVGGLFYLKCPRAYESGAEVLVLKRRPEVVVDQSRNTGPIEDNAATHRILMQSPTVVERAIREGKLDKLQCFANEKGDLTEALGKAISVSSVLKEGTGDMNTVNSVLRISFRGAVASECATVVNALVNSYRGFLEETYQTVSYDTVKLITEARGVLERDLERKEAAYREFRERSPMVWRGKDEVNPRQDRLAAIESQRAVILLRKADLKGQSVTIENMQKSGSSDEELAALVVRLARKSNEKESGERAAEDPLKSHLAPLLMDEENLRELLGPQHPQVLAMRQRIEALRNLLRATLRRANRIAAGSGFQRTARPPRFGRPVLPLSASRAGSGRGIGAGAGKLV